MKPSDRLRPMPAGGDSLTGVQTQTYRKEGDVAQSKEISSKPMDMIKGGGQSGDGPTTSSRSYPKGRAVSTTPKFNPMNAPASTYGIGGVGAGED